MNPLYSSKIISTIKQHVSTNIVDVNMQPFNAFTHLTFYNINVLTAGDGFTQIDEKFTEYATYKTSMTSRFYLNDYRHNNTAPYHVIDAIIDNKPYKVLIRDLSDVDPEIADVDFTMHGVNYAVIKISSNGNFSVACDLDVFGKPNIVAKVANADETKVKKSLKQTHTLDFDNDDNINDENNDEDDSEDVYDSDAPNSDDMNDEYNDFE